MDEVSVSASAVKQSGRIGRDYANGHLKRRFDILAASLGLVLGAPLFAIVAGLVLLSGTGSVLFRQVRVGRDGEPFEIFKFRTIRPGAEKATRLGRWLRKTSLDELPQLVNVLKGQMSIVGPRPHVPDMLVGGERYEALVLDYPRRLEVLPGMTGLAQSSGLRGTVTAASLAKARIEQDIDYIETASLRSDLCIILRTLRCEFLWGHGD